MGKKDRKRDEDENWLPETPKIVTTECTNCGREVVIAKSLIDPEGPEHCDTVWCNDCQDALWNLTQGGTDV